MFVAAKHSMLFRQYTKHNDSCWLVWQLFYVFPSLFVKNDLNVQVLHTSHYLCTCENMPDNLVLRIPALSVIQSLKLQCAMWGRRNTIDCCISCVCFNHCILLVLIKSVMKMEFREQDKNKTQYMIFSVNNEWAALWTVYVVFRIQKLYHLNTLITFHTHKTFIHLWNIN